MNWARLVLIIVALLTLWLGWAWYRYRQIVRELDRERAQYPQWTEDRL